MEFKLFLDLCVRSIQLGMVMGGQASRHSILRNKRLARQERLLPVLEYEEMRSECGKRHHLTPPVVKRVTSILEQEECLQERWQLTIMEGREPGSFPPTTRLAAHPNM